MTYALKLLFFVFAVGLPVAWLLRASFKDLLSDTEYLRAWQTLLAATIVAFLSMNPGVFMVSLGLVAAFARPRVGSGPRGAVATFVLLLVALPPISQSLGGVGGINHVLNLTHMRLLSLVLLLPPAWMLAFRVKARNERAANLLGFDLAILAYPVLKILLISPYSSYTSIFRMLVEAFIDTWLPYFVISRGLRTAADIRFVLTHFVLGCVFMASVAVVESITNKHLYQGLQYVYDIRWQLTATLLRDGFLRVQASMPQPIILAVVMIFGMAVWAWLRGPDWRKWPVAVVFVLFAWALVATWSRGPWLAASLMVLSLAALRRIPPRAFGVLLIGLVLGGALIKGTGADDIVMSALKSMFGESQGDTSSIDYRRHLMDTAISLIQQSPWWGVPDYQTYMESLKQGEGIIDLVNTYIGIALDAGVVGVSLFLLPFIWVTARLLGAAPVDRTRGAAAGWSFEATFVALTAAALFAIFTTSTWGVMPYLLLMLLAFPTAWLQLPAPRAGDAGDVGAVKSLDMPTFGRAGPAKQSRGAG